MPKKNYLGYRCERLEITGELPETIPGRFRWSFKCDCGQTGETTSKALCDGKESCGCLREERRLKAVTRHGKSRTAVHRIWSGMLARCTDRNSPNWIFYGGRGIAVCERWRTFENFLADMGEPPQGKTLDRRDNDLGYCKDNCRWATRLEQARNRRSNVVVTINGRSLSVSEWSGETGVPVATILGRIRRGTDPVEAVCTPSNPAFRRTKKAPNHVRVVRAELLRREPEPDVDTTDDTDVVEDGE